MPGLLFSDHSPSVVMTTVMAVVVMMLAVMLAVVLAVVMTVPALAGAAIRTDTVARGAVPSVAIALAGSVAAMNLNDVACLSLRSQQAVRGARKWRGVCGACNGPYCKQAESGCE